MSSSTSPNSRHWLFQSSIVLLGTLALCSLYFAPYSFKAPHPDAIPISSLPRVTSTCSYAPKKKRVAIIGAGSAGASTAYYLARAQAAGQIDPCLNLTVTIFERNGYIGGRSTTVQPYISKSSHSDSGYPLISNMIDMTQVDHFIYQQQPTIELGGSIFVKVNTNLVNAAQALGLTLQSALQDQPKASVYGWAVWDGVEILFQSHNDDSWWSELRRLYNRYGLAPYWTQRLMKSTVSKFRQLYDAPYFPWSNLTMVVEAVGLESATGVSGQAFVDLKGISDIFSWEIIQASTRVTYAQKLQEIHGLGSMVCMATDGAMRVKGGNWQIFSGMIANSGAELRLNTSVQSIHSQHESKTGARFVIKSAPTSREPNSIVSDRTEEFDDMIIATPLQFSNIDTDGLSSKYTLPKPIPYVSLHVTLLATKRKIGTSYFMDKVHEIPEAIFTVPPNRFEDPDLPFQIIALRNLTNPQTGEHEFAYKIFSSFAVDERFLTHVFGGDEWVMSNISWIYQHTWNSYPYLLPRTVFDGPDLGNGLWYANGIEAFISTMETSSLAGSNIAALLVQSWEKSQDEFDPEPKLGL